MINPLIPAINDAGFGALGFIGFALGAFFSLISLAVVVGLVYLLVRFLLVATHAAQIYVAKDVAASVAASAAGRKIVPDSLSHPVHDSAPVPAAETAPAATNLRNPIAEGADPNAPVSGVALTDVSVAEKSVKPVTVVTDESNPRLPASTATPATPAEPAAPAEAAASAEAAKPAEPEVYSPSVVPDAAVPTATGAVSAASGVELEYLPSAAPVVSPRATDSLAGNDHASEPSAVERAAARPAAEPTSTSAAKPKTARTNSAPRSPRSTPRKPRTPKTPPAE